MKPKPEKPEPPLPQQPLHQPSYAGVILADESAGQERRFAEAFSLIRKAVAERAFPGAALAVALGGRLLAWQGFGRFTYDAASSEVRRETVWDLASLTKPIATASMAMLCFEHKPERGQLSLDAHVADYLPEFAEAGAAPHAEVDAAAVNIEVQREWRRSVTVAMLLAHSSGLPAHRKLYLQAQGREAMLAAARRLPLEARPGTRAEYSDLGFMILGELLERLAGESLDQFCRRELFDPLNLNLKFSPRQAERQGIPPTVNDIVYRHRIVQGEVNDENASAMGGVAGHAGLFGDALSVARFAECLLQPQQANCGHAGGGEGRRATAIFHPETVALFTARQAVPPGTSRTLGWDTPSPPSQSGTMFSARSFGHLGYTGTSLWCDPERQLSVTLLTNRTWPDSHNQAVKAVRPRVHDAILAALGV